MMHGTSTYAVYFVYKGHFVTEKIGHYKRLVPKCGGVRFTAVSGGNEIFFLLIYKQIFSSKLSAFTIKRVALANAVISNF